MIQLRFGRCTFDPESRSVACDGHAIPLTTKSAELLALLLEQPNAVIASGLLRDRLWPAGFVEPGNLAQQVYVLRRALAVDPSVSIENVARRGYRLRADVAGARSRRPFWQAIHGRSLAAPLVAALALVVLPGGATLVHGDSRAITASAERSYALGRYFWERRGSDNFDRAEAYFRRTVALAPTSALGYAGLSEVWGLRADADMRHGRALAKRALNFAQLALARDSESAVAHAALGLALLEADSDRKAIAELRRAIELDPKNAEAHEWYALQLLMDGDVRDAAKHLEIAAELQPENVAVTTWHAWMRYYLRDFDQAAADFRTALELNPAFETAQLGLIASLVRRGSYRDAKDALQSVHPREWSTLRALHALGAIADLRLGLKKDADEEARRLQAEARSRLGDDDEFVVAALALDGLRGDALRLRARMHLEKKPSARRMIDLDPLVGPVFRQLASNV